MKHSIDMGRKQIPSKKAPSDYPQMAFRVSNQDKIRIQKTILKIQTLLNKTKDKDAPFVNKNDVILKALDIGFKKLSK
ncbi:MAG: hypothetical protein H6623_02700 [Bdellovibrionaceae bacterium]|nr:hypothetical protein [Pseudobdellovibrionaceae bacterium]